MLSYQQAIQQSLREVSDALVGYGKGREFREQQQLLNRAATAARRLADGGGSRSWSRSSPRAVIERAGYRRPRRPTAASRSCRRTSRFTDYIVHDTM